MKLIGKSFTDELHAAGIAGDGIAWGSDGVIQYREDVTQAARDAVAIVLAAHDPMASAVAGLRATAIDAVDSAAGAARGRYITLAPGQEMTYLIKAQQAAAYRAAGYPAASIVDYPFIQAKAKSSKASPTAAGYQAAADAIYNKQAAWMASGAAIEQAREAGKAAVNAAITAAAITAARDSAVAALKAL